MAGALLCEKISAERLIRPNLGYTDEMIAELPYFEVVVSGDENRGIPCDVEGYSLGDGYIHLTLPPGVYKKAVVVYIRDAGGILLARRVFDLTQTAMLGPWQVVLDEHCIPTLFFESSDPAEYEAMNASEDKSVICTGITHICAGDRTIDISGLNASLQGRGSSSWGADSKKSYSLRLNKAVDLLGLGKNKNWNLVGNAFDVSLLKNITFNKIAEEAGIPYQPGMRNINLYVDGKYCGVYTLTTKVTVDKNRIPLKEGDYFYKMDPPEQDQPLLYRSETWFEDGMEYPVADLLYPENADQREMAEALSLLQVYINTIEDPENAALKDVCDLSLLAKYYWIEEASMNFDAWQRSVYMYYLKNDGRMHMGPVWDMDLALGSPYEKEGMSFDTPEGWRVRNAGWYRELFKNEDFKKAVADEYFNGGVREALLSGTDEFAAQRRILAQDGRLNFLLYGYANQFGEKSIYGDIDDYDEYCDDIVSFYSTRAAWIDEQMKP